MTKTVQSVEEFKSLLSQLTILNEPQDIRNQNIPSVSPVVQKGIPQELNKPFEQGKADLVRTLLNEFRRKHGFEEK